METILRRDPGRVIAGPMVMDVGYVATSFENTGAKFLDDDVYGDRGNAELFIKEHKLGLGSDRSPCRLISLGETASRLSLSKHAVYRLIAGNILPAPVKVGGQTTAIHESVQEERCFAEYCGNTDQPRRGQ